MTESQRNSRFKRWRLSQVTWLLIVSCTFASTTPSVETIELGPGGSRTLKFPVEIGTAFVANPQTADVEVLNNETLFVFGHKIGITSLSVFDTAGELLAAYRVRVSAHSEQARTVVARIAGEDAPIRVDSIGNSLFVSGTAKSPSEAERVLRGIRAVSGETPIVDAIGLDGPAQVNLEVLISEVSRNVSQTLGIDWSADLNPFESPLRTWVTGTGTRLGTGALNIANTLEQSVLFYPVGPDGQVGSDPQFVNQVRELAVSNPVRGGDGGVVLSHSELIQSDRYRATVFLEALAGKRPRRRPCAAQSHHRERPASRVLLRPGDSGSHDNRPGDDRHRVSANRRQSEFHAYGAGHRPDFAHSPRPEFEKSLPAAQPSPARSCPISMNGLHRPPLNWGTGSQSPSPDCTGAARQAARRAFRCSRTFPFGAPCFAIPANGTSLWNWLSWLRRVSYRQRRPWHQRLALPGDRRKGCSNLPMSSIINPTGGRMLSPHQSGIRSRGLHRFLGSSPIGQRCRPTEADRHDTPVRRRTCRLALAITLATFLAGCRSAPADGEYVTFVREVMAEAARLDDEEGEGADRSEQVERAVRVWRAEEDD